MFKTRDNKNEKLYLIFKVLDLNLLKIQGIHKSSSILVYRSEKHNEQQIKDEQIRLVILILNVFGIIRYVYTLQFLCQQHSTSCSILNYHFK